MSEQNRKFQSKCHTPDHYLIPLPSMRDVFWMQQALNLAKIAAQDDEVPIGAVIVKDHQIIGIGRNRREKDKNALAHAEIEAIHQACQTLDSWRLHGCTLYVTLEPCPMCMGAIINARLDRVVYGAKDAKAGCCGSMLNLNDFPFNHHPVVMSDVCCTECADALSAFFTKLRLRRKKKKTHLSDTISPQFDTCVENTVENV